MTQTRRGDTGAVVLATKIRLENGNDHTEVRGNYCAGNKKQGK